MIPQGGLWQRGAEGGDLLCEAPLELSLTIEGKGSHARQKDFLNKGCNERFFFPPPIN